MGLDFCSAPATSVDAKRAFSHRHHQINFMQHNIASNTFIAQMAVGSWNDTLLFSNINNAFSILEAKTSQTTGS
ncbi:uncharacterized protein FOMMEDRAFT_98363 [Fomitiporia mediterranea MF3/22]|uniref:HAT C-terminal dimerisation domain-containing protein n=1 Tax=Fomitiporia mediterranea (strain MF3/22) TaxID=694068 RepID=R7SJE6_FOMME|nr:uncharacterized protein FOMMEDRAFT_98363 [Fomitiporia mediterranea MF3/22]EJC97719.1 hypothetical protein FOMMEDRAFT_98363 [Fomitiporia mediterranea MF3/22]